MLLFFAARSLHLQNAIIPALNHGTWVVCDRFTDASRAYQGCGRGIDLGKIEYLAEWVQQGLEPDLTLLLDAPAELGMRRTEQRGAGDRMDNEARVFYERVRSGYLTLADMHPQRFAVIDASCGLYAVQAAIARDMDRLFSNKAD